MKLPSLSTLFLLALALLGGHPSSAQNQSSASKQPTGKWQKVTSKASHFSVEMPGAPTLQPRPKNPDPYWNYVDKDVHAVYSATARPIDATTPAKAEGILQKQLADMIKTYSAKVLSQKHLTLAGYPGIEIRFETSGGVQWRELAYILKNHQYLLMVKGTAKNIDAPDVARFFKSFSVSNP